MEFSPNNKVIRLCMQGIAMEEQGKPAEATLLFLQAWNEAANDFEKFIAAYYFARQRESAADRLQWYQTALQLALVIDSPAVEGALPALYLNIGKCYEELGDIENAKMNHELATLSSKQPSDKGPFYHGTKADLKVGDLLIPGFGSNYQDDLLMNHIYFTAVVNGAGLAAELAKGDAPERVYIIMPTGDFENDPNVTDKKFPGNPTRSYRTTAPLKIVGETAEWDRQSPEDIKKWRDRLANTNGQIIN